MKITKKDINEAIFQLHPKQKDMKAFRMYLRMDHAKTPEEAEIQKQKIKKHFDLKHQKTMQQLHEMDLRLKAFETFTDTFSKIRSRSSSL